MREPGRPWLQGVFPEGRRALSLTEPQFRYGFTNAVPEKEARHLYAEYAVPGPARPLFQAATATFDPKAATKVNIGNATRGPLLLIAGVDDHTVPPVLVRSTLKAYRKSTAVTDFKEFTGRGHSLTIDSGWHEIAEYCLSWLRGKQLQSWPGRRGVRSVCGEALLSGGGGRKG
jgi:pimeloyl-ACP methyl ester carboxylesterase